MELITKVSQVIAKSGKTTTDSLSDLIKKALLKEDLSSIPEEKRRILEEFIEFLSIRTVKFVEDQKTKKTKLILTKVASPNPDNVFEILFQEDPIEIETEIPEIDEILTSAFLGDAFTESYTIPTDLFQDLNIAEEIFENPQYTYHLKITGAKEESIINIITNKGLIEIIKKLVAIQEENVFIPVSRIQALNVMTAKVLSDLYLKENRKKPANVIVKTDDKTVESFLSTIKTEKLIEKKIYLKHIQTQAELDKEMLKAKQTKDQQTVLIASAKSVTRGVDLSFFDKMIIAGDLDRNGREFTQLVARLYNNDPSCIYKEIYLYGTPSKFMFIKGIHKTIPSDYVFGMKKLKNVYLFNKEILSGSTQMISDDSGTVKLLYENENKIANN